MTVLLTALLNFTVNYLLILAAAGLCRFTPSLGRALLGAGLGALHGVLCLVPGFGFLGHIIWRLISIPLMGTMAFGRKRLRLLGTLFVLCLGMDAVVADTGIRGTLAGLSTVVLLWLLLRKGRENDTVPLQLEYADKELTLTALRDTGNCLRDPITGDRVLVIGAEAAEKLTGLTAQQLKSPLETMGALPGLRLIPYKAVGSSGFLLGLKLPRVRIDNWQGSYVVAFAPMGLDGNVDALIGGTV